MAWIHVRAGEFVRCQRSGAWDRTATLDVDWRGAGPVALTGRVLDSKGRPIADAVVVPVDGTRDHGPLPDPVGRSGKDGRLRVLQPATTPYLLGYENELECHAQGPWPKDARVDLRPLE